MPEPKTATTKIPREDPAPPRYDDAGPEFLTPLVETVDRTAGRDRPRRERELEEPAPAPRRGMNPVLFGLLLVAGGIAVWGSLRGDRTDVPDVWDETTGPDGPAPRMVAQVKPSGPARLLRLEWPAHPQAESYRIRFVDERGVGPAAVPVQSTVFLYDMETNVLHLPARFEWVVAAVLPDGTEILTPVRHYPE